jgi:3-oxoacyl-[acyl-carrier protein] reductase
MSASDLFKLDGRVALVTGASRGIGAAIAQSLAQAGADVWLAGRDLSALETAAATCPRGKTLPLDVTDEAAIKAAMLKIRQTSGGLDILVNNAGIMAPAMLATTRAASLDAMLRTHVSGSFLCSQLAARLMSARQGGAILNMASVMGTRGAAGFSAYGASKAAVVGMTLALAKELAPLQIRVNALAPGFIESDLTAGIEGPARAQALADIGMGRFGQPRDVAAAALYLVSPAAAYVTGQVLGIDGAMKV